MGKRRSSSGGDIAEALTESQKSLLKLPTKGPVQMHSAGSLRGEGGGASIPTNPTSSGPPNSGVHRKRSTSVMVISGLANLIGDKRKAGFRRAKTSTLQQEGSTKAIEDSKVATM